MARYRVLFPAAALVLAVIAAYIPAMQAGFIWDDDRYVMDNPMLVVEDGLQRIWFSTDHRSQYFPMTYTLFYMQQKLWGMNPAGYHIFNILLHAVNALLLWRLLHRMGLPGALAAAALFALHPVHVESVAWITELKNVSMTFFSLLSLLAWLTWIGRSREGERAWRYFIFSLLLYTAALLCKTTACTLPAALVLILWLKRVPIDFRRWLQIAPYVLFGLAMGLLTLWWEQVHLGLHPLAGELNFLERILIGCRALWFYLGKLVLPMNLSFSYPRWEMAATDPMSYVGFIACIMACALLWFARKKTGRNPIAAALFFVATLSPMLGLISLYTFFWTFVADHYQYMASMGMIALAAGAGATLARCRMKWRMPVQIVTPAVLVVFGCLTFLQARVYENEERLWQDTIEKNPASWLAHVNLGAAMGRQGRLDDAMALYRKALSIYPEAERAYRNMGNIYLERGELDEAIEHYEKALSIRPEYAEVLNDLGVALSRKGDHEGAIEKYERALELEPEYVLAHRNLALDLVKINRHEEALPHFLEVAYMKPYSANAHSDLGNVLMALKRPDEAIARYRKALELAEQEGNAPLVARIRAFLQRVNSMRR